jgi:hypothetical protein
VTRYFFDLIDNDSHYIDREGIALLGDDRAVGEARRIVADVMRDGLASDVGFTTDSTFSLIVRTAETQVLITLAVTLSIRTAAVQA